MNCKHWVNSQEAALSLGIAVGTPRRWGKAGKLHTVQTAGHLARQLERLRVAANERGYQVRVEVLDPPERIAPTPELLAGILTLVTVLSGKLYASRAPANPRRKASVIGSRVQQKSGKKDELPVKCSRHLWRRMREKDWKRLSPTLVLRGKGPRCASHRPKRCGLPAWWRGSWTSIWSQDDRPLLHSGIGDGARRGPPNPHRRSLRSGENRLPEGHPDQDWQARPGGQALRRTR